jgi:hypothetical protein
MAIYYVDPGSGDDGNNGLDPASAFRTIKRGTAELIAGDVLRLHAGSVYGPTARFSADLHGEAAQPIVIEPYPDDPVAVVDGRVRNPDLAILPNAESEAEWEQVPGGHCEEWRTRQVLDEDVAGARELARVRYGAFVDSRIRLITYARIEDLRATNESFLKVPLSDPREAGGPLVDDPTRKRPWTYLGPGLHWLFEHPGDPKDRRGRVHVRLSATHLGAAGAGDYAGPIDPNQVALALTPEGRKVVVVGGSNIEFRNLVIANGGETTLQVTENARNVTFDHCSIYGGREGVRIEGGADGVTFTHCTFDGALAPWTVRSDVKEDYDFIDDDGQIGKNGTGRATHAHLVISQGAPNVEFAHCTFRRAHDALLLGGTNVSVHHCLFEDLNDEVVQFSAPAPKNAHVYKNLFRQVLHPFSFALSKELEEVGGPIFIYRNVIDQRLPTRGYRVLPDDAPAPHIFRYGTSYKTGHPMPGVHIYQNTFVAADRDDKATALSLLFDDSDLSTDTEPRVHLNNLLVGLDLDMPYTWLATPSALRRSDGNLWYSPQRDVAALALFEDVDGLEHVKTIARMHELGGEQASKFEEPNLINFDDEIFDHGRYLGDDYPNNDWRPVPGGPAHAAGVPLPDNLEDPDRPEGSKNPDIGAMVAKGPPLRVGADDEVEQPAPNTPIAHAGPDQLVIDADGDGFASVTLNGSESTTPTGAITSYVWTSRQVTVATQPTATLTLPEGDHYLRLAVTNSAGRTDTDGLRVKIRPPKPHGDNLVRNGGFEDDTAWQITGASIVTRAHTGHRALRLNPQGAVVKQRILVTPKTRYQVSAWVRIGNPDPFQPPVEAATMRVRVVFLDPNDCPITTVKPFPASFTPFPATASYAYRSADFVAPEAAVAMDLALGTDNALFVDDVRVLDDNLLTNAGFETRAPSGSDNEAPAWTFEGGDARVVTNPIHVRSGTRAVALEGIPSNYRQVLQEIRTLTGATRYRITAWLKTVNLTASPTMFARFDTGGNRVIASETSPGAFKLIGRELDAPAGAQRLTVRLRLERGASGTAYFDDLLVSPLP